MRVSPTAPAARPFLGKSACGKTPTRRSPPPPLCRAAPHFGATISGVFSRFPKPETVCPPGPTATKPAGTQLQIVVREWLGQPSPRAGQCGHYGHSGPKAGAGGHPVCCRSVSSERSLARCTNSPAIISSCSTRGRASSSWPWAAWSSTCDATPPATVENAATIPQSL
jgi:hypothetical protein